MLHMQNMRINMQNKCIKIAVCNKCVKNMSTICQICIICNSKTEYAWICTPHFADVRSKSSWLLTNSTASEGRRRQGAMQHRDYIGRESPGLLRDSDYDSDIRRLPAASRAGTRPCGLASGKPNLKLLLCTGFTPSGILTTWHKRVQTCLNHVYNV